MKKYEPNFNDRLGAAAKAKQALVEKARANAPSNDPKFAEKLAARKAAAEERKARSAERRAARLAEKEAKLAEKARLIEEAAARKARQKR